MMPLILAALFNMTPEPSIDFIDSQDDPKVTYLIINKTCKVPLFKTELRDWDEVVRKAERICGSALSL
jgi:hypothetical protein